jgi:hypothetical protein
MYIHVCGINYSGVFVIPVKRLCRKYRFCNFGHYFVISTGGRNLVIEQIRFLTYVRNDILSCCDTASKPGIRLLE